MHHSIRRFLPLLLLAFSAQPALAHFAWLAVDADGKAILFFGENVADRTYHMPESIAKAKVQQFGKDNKPQQVELAPVDSEKFVGLASEKKLDSAGTLASSVTYGIYQGARLDYSMLHFGGKLPTELTAVPKERPALTAQLVDTPKGVDVYVYWQGKPLAGAKVQLFCDEGHEEGTAKTDADGKVSFTDSEVEEGLNGILVGHTVKDTPGELNGKKYTSAAHYLTVTFADPE